MTAVLLAYALKAVLRDSKTPMALRDIKIALYATWPTLEWTEKQLELALQAAMQDRTLVPVGPRTNQRRYAWAS